MTRGDLLAYALELVVANDGAPGVDGQSLDSITANWQTRNQWLGALQHELQTQTYRPSPVRRVYIPKSDGGQLPLGIPTVKDRVVQMAALQVLAPIFEADFHPHSYGFRPKRNAHQALDAIIAALRQGKLEVVDADLSKYFDTIPHPRLVQLLARRISDGSILHLLRQWLDVPIVEEDRDGRRRLLPNRQGVPQGGVISPLLANLYLTDAPPLRHVEILPAVLCPHGPIVEHPRADFPPGRGPGMSATGRVPRYSFLRPKLMRLKPATTRRYRPGRPLTCGTSGCARISARDLSGATASALEAAPRSPAPATASISSGPAQEPS